MPDSPSLVGRTVSHYRILEKIGAGGMGEVYRAHDEQLDRDVAVKVLPHGMLENDAVRKQFRKEALVLAKLNHPYIETVHEFGSQDGIDFLVMEMIPGESLSAMLSRGCLAEKEILRVGVQFLSGLAAAHDQGVIHSDLKPANIFVTPDGRVKILDFGLAKLVHPEQAVDLTRSITTDTGTISGTVPYMAPEQLRGEPTDVRSDIYSAGAVLYEMATGRRPFPQTQGPQLMGAILHESPAPPSTLNPQISPELESGIMRALEKTPSRRYQSALELQSFLESLAAALSSGGAHLRAKPEMPVQNTTPVEPGARHKLFVGGALISVPLLAVLLIGLNVNGLRDRLMHGAAPNDDGSVPVSSAIKARPSVAVLGFKNVSGRPEEAWLSTALSEMLTTELAVGEQLRTVPGENVARMKIDLSLPDADTYGKETLANIRKNIGTDAVVLGSYVPLGKGQLRLDLRLQNTAAGETMAAVSEKGTEEQLDDLVSRAGVALRRKLGAGAVSDTDAASVKAALPSNTEAARLYAEGLAKLRLFDNLAARDLMEKAVAIEPTHALSHSNLAAAWVGLGYDANAAAEAKRAFDLSQGLSRQDHLSVEGRYRETTREWDKAVEIYKTLFGFFPDNLDYGLSLAQSQTRAGNGTAALATVETLRKIPAPQNEDPRIDLAEAIAAQSLSDYTHELKAATRAAEKGQATGARLLLARARLSQSIAFRQLGRTKDARAAIEDARQIFAAAGDRNGVASAENGIANILSNQGDIPGAKKQFESALAIYHEIGNKAGAGKVLGNLATEVSNGGDMAGGRKLCEEALVLLQESGDKTAIANGQNNLATYLTLQGDLAGATDLFRQSLKLRQEIGDKGGEAESLNNLAELLAEQGDGTAARAAFNESFRLHQERGQKGASTYQLNGLGKLLLNSGDLPGATQRLEQSQAIAREIEEKPLLPASLAGMGDVFLQQDRLSDARKGLEQALAIDKELGYREEADEISLGLAELNIEDGRPADAQVLIQAALKGFRNAKLRDNEIWAHTLLARALLAQKQLNDARKEIELGRELAAKSQNRLVVLAFTITEARVLFASGNLPAAFALLDSALAEAKKSGLVRYELQARLALAEMEVKSGKDIGRGDLATLRNDAKARGFELIAKKTAAL